MKWVRIGAAPAINIFIRSPKVTKKSEVPVIFDIIDSYVFFHPGFRKMGSPHPIC